MKSYNRITLYVVMLAVIAMVILPKAIAQPSGPGRGVRGGGGGRGDMMGGPPGRGGDRGRGGPGGMPWMGREELTDFQINLILKAYSNRDPNQAKKLEDQRKDMSRDAFEQTLIRYATPEYFQITTTERNYTYILNWCEKYVSDEAQGIKELKEVNYELYKKRLDTLDNKYRRIINMPASSTPEELIPILVKDLQLGIKQGELVMQIRTADTQDKKDSLTADLKEVVSERYHLNIDQRNIQLKQIQKQIEGLQQNLKFEMNQIEVAKDPNVAEEAIDRRVSSILSGFFGGFPRGNRPGHDNRTPQYLRPDVIDPNSKPAN